MDWLAPSGRACRERQGTACKESSKNLGGDKEEEESGPDGVSKTARPNRATQGNRAAEFCNKVLTTLDHSL